jgi:hypothetical protein
VAATFGTVVKGRVTVVEAPALSLPVNTTSPLLIPPKVIPEAVAVVRPQPALAG